MKPWLRHFILGIIIGAISIIMMRVLLYPEAEFSKDSNLLVTIFVILSYGVGTAILGEILMAFDHKK